MQVALLGKARGVTVSGKGYFLRTRISLFFNGGFIIRNDYVRMYIVDLLRDKGGAILSDRMVARTTEWSLDVTDGRSAYMYNGTFAF